MKCVCGRPIIEVLGRQGFEKKCQGHTFREMGFSQKSLDSIAEGIAQRYTDAGIDLFAAPKPKGEGGKA